MYSTHENQISPSKCAEIEFQLFSYIFHLDVECGYIKWIYLQSSFFYYFRLLSSFLFFPFFYSVLLFTKREEKKHIILEYYIWTEE